MIQEEQLQKRKDISEEAEEAKAPETEETEDAEKAAEEEESEEAEEMSGEGEEPSETAELLAELNLLRRERRDRELCADEWIGETYGILRDEVLTLIGIADGQGIELGPDEVFYALLAERLPELLADARQEGEAMALRAIAASAAATPLSLGGGEPPRITDYDSMKDDEFDRLVRRALRGELRGSGM